MASTVSRSVVLALEVLDAEALHRALALHASERFEMCLCAQIAKGVVPTFPCVVLPLPATRPSALAFSLAVAQYLLDSPADDVIFYGPVWHSYCLRQLQAAGLVNCAIDSDTMDTSAQHIFCSAHQSLASTQAKRPFSLSQAPSRHATVSVVVTHFNRPEYVGEAIASVLAQVVPPQQLIIVDDASDANSWMSLKKLVKSLPGHVPVKLIRNDTNRGLGASRNIGAASAESDYLLFLDDDDALHPSALAHVQKASGQIGADVYTIGFLRSAEAPIATSSFKGDNTATTILYLGDDGVYYSLYEDQIGGATSMIKRSCFAMVGGFHERREVAADDWQLYIRMLAAGHVIFHLPIPLLWYRSTQNSMSHRTLTQYREQRDTFVAETIFKSQYAPSLEELRFLQQRNSECLLTQRYWAFAEEAVQRLSSVWQDLTLYCANSIAQCMILVARETLGSYPKQIVDGSDAKHGSFLEGLCVRKPERLESSDSIVVCSDTFYDEIAQSLHNNNIRRVSHWRSVPGSVTRKQAIGVAVGGV